MGNAIYYCMVQQVTTVRVMRADGEVLEFDQPLIAKQLMKMYPGHLVVHCSQVSRTSGLAQRSKVSMLRADDTLHLGQTYCLLRVPAQRGKVLLPTGPGMPTGINGEADAAQIEQQIHYRLPLAALQQQQFGGPWKPHLDAIIESPLNSNAPSRGHSVTMSPLARQAGYTPMSPLRTAHSPLRASSSDHYAGF
ncbi:unnamed protein product [Calypogeia fissa]